MHLGPDDILLATSIDVQDGIGAAEVQWTKARIEKAITARFPAVRRLFIEVPNSVDHRRSLAHDNGPAGTAASPASTSVVAESVSVASVVIPAPAPAPIAKDAPPATRVVAPLHAAPQHKPAGKSDRKGRPRPR